MLNIVPSAYKGFASVHSSAELEASVEPAADLAAQPKALQWNTLLPLRSIANRANIPSKPLPLTISVPQPEQITTITNPAHR